MLMALKIDVLMAQLSSEDFLDTFSVSKDNLSLSGTQRSDWRLVALEEAVYFLHIGIHARNVAAKDFTEYCNADAVKPEFILIV